MGAHESSPMRESRDTRKAGGYTRCHLIWGPVSRRPHMQPTATNVVCVTHGKGAPEPLHVWTDCHPSWEPGICQKRGSGAWGRGGGACRFWGGGGGACGGSCPGTIEFPRAWQTPPVHCSPVNHLSDTPASCSLFLRLLQSSEGPVRVFWSASRPPNAGTRQEEQRVFASTVSKHMGGEGMAGIVVRWDACPGQPTMPGEHAMRVHLFTSTLMPTTSSGP